MGLSTKCLCCRLWNYKRVGVTLRCKDHHLTLDPVIIVQEIEIVLEGWFTERCGLLREVVFLEGWSTLRGGLFKGMVIIEGWATLFGGLHKRANC